LEVFEVFEFSKIQTFSPRGSLLKSILCTSRRKGKSMKKKTKSVDQWCAEKETEERSERGRERELVVRVERLKLGAESVVEVYRRT
jgi:hypothetical protein